MVNAIRTGFVLFFCMLLLVMISAHPVAKSVGSDSFQTNEIGDIGPESEDMETQMMNYLVAQQLFSRLRNQMVNNDLQRKRSYWKQCAFNAVSCFGRKK
ncbi:prohormone-1-like [Diaphorina citri]|uniref:AstC n=1 Tax=Diaphorina citri TaxID=121845 RepID=A0A2U9PFZ2_DIACI|nr:prohormone-1-like [Diaphorina citri]AWT50587.1 AstC [Diaphorina citri]KAI5711373.1 hypothetical protein M8J75_016524 [Diaphorina citri]KAI5745916.1 hypothetical protein M8J76_015509 [Diaphorina citri]KAI5750929.1 hypothetical protein M8J77_002548 [Diaphorina citri]